MFFRSFLILILILILQWTYRDSVLYSDARLHVNPIHFLARRAVCKRLLGDSTQSKSKFHHQTYSKLYLYDAILVHRVSWQRQSNVIRYLACGSLGTRVPVTSLGETLMKPTTMLYRNLASMDVEESIRANSLDGVVLLTGCDKTTPA